MVSNSSCLDKAPGFGHNRAYTRKKQYDREWKIARSSPVKRKPECRKISGRSGPPQRDSYAEGKLWNVTYEPSSSIENRLEFKSQTGEREK